MTQLSPHPRLLQYHRLRDELVVLLRQLTNLAEQRNLDLLDDPYLESQVLRQSASNQRQLRSLIEQKIQQIHAPFQIAVVGEFTRGKTTLINALLGQSVLTSDRRPNTAACTRLNYGDHNRIRVTYLNSIASPPIEISSQNLAADLASYTSDAAMDPDRYEALLRREEKSLAEQVDTVNVWLPADFLGQHGYEVIDTPGLGSVFDSHQAVTYNIISQVDAILFLTQFNALIGEEELFFLSSLREHLDRFLFVLTKVDLAVAEQNAQRSIQRAVEFVQSVLMAQLDFSDISVHPVAANLAIEEQNYKESGMIELSHALDQKIVSACGHDRLLKLCRSAYTHHFWVKQDVQLEIEHLESQLSRNTLEQSRLTAIQRSTEQFEGQLRHLLSHQTEEILQQSLSSLEKLSNRLYSGILGTLNKLNLRALKTANTHLYTTIDQLVQDWLDEREKEWEYSTLLLLRDTAFLLSTILHKDVALDWKISASKARITSPDLPDLASCLNQIRFQVVCASITGMAQPVREHIARELLEVKAHSNQATYQAVFLCGNNPTSIYNQAELIFNDWIKSFHTYLEKVIHQEVAQYWQQIEMEHQQVNQQQDTLQQQLKQLRMHQDQVEEISQQLRSIQSGIDSIEPISNRLISDL